MTNRVFDFLISSDKEIKNNVALSFKRKGEWKGCTYNDLLDEVNKISASLLARGLKKGDMIASVSPNRPELVFLDLALQQIGVIHIPLHPSYSIQDLTYILNETQVKYLFTGNKTLHKLIKLYIQQFQHLEYVYCFEEGKDVQNWKEIIVDTLVEDDHKKIFAAREKISPEDPVCILYTSGTGGNPKGVIQKHISYCVFFNTALSHFGLAAGDRALSVLSFSHAYERILTYLFLWQGMTVHYSDGVTGLPQLLWEVKPQVIPCVPVIIETIYKYLIDRARSEFNPELVQAFLELTSRFTVANQEEFYASGEYQQFHYLIRFLRQQLGGEMIQMTTGAATVPLYLVRFFWSIRVPIYDCYGSTEAIFHTLNHQNFAYKMGSVGKPLPFARIQIGAGNEIWVKSPALMRGYYNNEELTREVVTEDGWYKSGDVGYLDEDGFLYLTGRANAIFKLLNGKYVNPEDVEQQLRLSNTFNAVLITQDADKFLTAVVSVDGDPQEIDTISAVIRDINELYNNRKVETERIKRLILVQGKWSVQTGEYTPTMKLKRKYLEQKYKDMLSNSISL